MSDLQDEQDEGDFDDPSSSLYSHRQRNILLSLYYVTPPLSLIGSCVIAYVIAKPGRSLQNVNPTFIRLLLGYALMDAMQTVVWIVLGPWAEGYSVATCNVKGFFMNFVFGLMLYSASLASYHAAVVVLEWPTFFITRGFEPAFHFLAWAWPTLVGAPSIFYDNVNPYDLLPGTCWIIAHDSNNTDTNHTNSNTNNDGRGDPEKAESVEYVFGFTTFVLSLLVTTIAFLMLWCKARAVERRLARTSRNMSVVTSLSRTTAQQGMRYSIAFLLCNISWPFLVFMNRNRLHDDSLVSHLFFPLAVYSMIMTPLQGFVNAILFLEGHRTVFDRRCDGPLAGLAKWYSNLSQYTMERIKHHRRSSGSRRRETTTLETTTDRGADSHAPLPLPDP